MFPMLLLHNWLELVDCLSVPKTDDAYIPNVNLEGIKMDQNFGHWSLDFVLLEDIQHTITSYVYTNVNYQLYHDKILKFF